VVRICIIGDSHIGAAKGGWTQQRQKHPGISIGFFGAPHNEMNGLQLENGRLIPDNDKLRDQLVMTGRTPEIAADYDVYAVYGLRLRLRDMRGILRKQNLAALKKRPKKRERAIRHLLKTMRRTCCIQTLVKVRQCTAAPVLLIATPYQPANPEKSASAAGNRKGKITKALFDEACRRLAAEADAIYVPQPEETIAPTRTNTLARLRSPRENDKTHMNDEFGAILMQRIVEVAQAALAAV
jgi:hypothetical protein